MFLGGMGGSAEGQPDYPENDEARMKRVENKLDQIAAKQSAPPQPGQADYPTQEAANSGGPADPNKDFWFLNRTEGEEYGSADLTGAEKKQQAEDIAAIRDTIKHMAEEEDKRGSEHAQAEESIFDIAA